MPSRIPTTVTLKPADRMPYSIDLPKPTCMPKPNTSTGLNVPYDDAGTRLVLALESLPK
ncbi:Uncharacterised protein [Burkholderia pseudomallei]|nr:Uncharacterised protein [Burkholderia pseudomallei]